MGKSKQTRKFAVTKKVISPKDVRVKSVAEAAKAKQVAKKKEEEPRQVEQAVSALFFQYNTQLGPPYHILVDTNFLNFSIRYAIYTPYMSTGIPRLHSHSCAALVMLLFLFFFVDVNSFVPFHFFMNPFSIMLGWSFFLDCTCLVY
jgi:hypothetical protein